jgi:hypothetical protein
MKIGYLYIIVTTIDFNSVKEAIIKGMKSLNLDIYGRRYFKHLMPERPAANEPSCNREFAYPKYNPYSWVIKAKFNY